MGGGYAMWLDKNFIFWQTCRIADSYAMSAHSGLAKLAGTADH
jgi:hypothetical protein